MANRLTGNRRDFLRRTAGIIAGAAIVGSARPAAAAIEAGGGREALAEISKRMDRVLAGRDAFEDVRGFWGGGPGTVLRAKTQRGKVRQVCAQRWRGLA